MSDDKRDLNQVYDEFGSVGSLKENFYDWHGANEWIFKQINSIRGNLYDHTMQIISDLGKHENFKYYLILAVIYAIASTALKKLKGNGGVKQHLCKWLGVLLVLPVAYAASGLTTKYLKNEFAYERPYQKYDSKDVFWLEPQESKKANESFPSGHATFIMMLLVALWPVLSENMRWFGMLTALGVGWSRMALGVHFPADVVAGFMVGAVATWLVRKVIYSFIAKLFKIHC